MGLRSKRPRMWVATAEVMKGHLQMQMPPALVLTPIPQRMRTWMGRSSLKGKVLFQMATLPMFTASSKRRGMWM
jgi:hypothetical protein